MISWFRSSTQKTQPTLISKRQSQDEPTTNDQDTKKPRVHFSHHLMVDPTTEPEPLLPLNWRLDPTKSHSDCKIELVGSDGVCKTYHVHQNMMLSSERFARLVQERDVLAPNMTFRVRAMVKDPYFSDFLDYIYRLHVEIHQGNAAALYYWSRIMQVRRLRWETREFWKGDVTLSSLAFYYDAAITFEEPELMKHVLATCLQDDMFLKLNEDSKVLSNPCPRLLVHLVRAIEPKDEEHLSTLVAAFCEHHRESLDAATFQDLTQPLSSIAVETIPCLLGLSQQFPHADGAFEKVCLETLMLNWKSIDIQSQAVFDVLMSQSKHFLVQFLWHSIAEVQDDDEEYQEDEEQEEIQQAIPLAVVAPYDSESL